jgi:hypothetical protein
MGDLTELMTQAVEDQPPLAITRESAIAAGRRAVRRRRTGVAALVVGCAAALVAGAGAVPRHGPDTSAAPNVVTYPVPQLPRAVGVPGVADRPTALGSDPLLIHFGLDSSAWPLGEATYESRNGTESVQASALNVTVSRSKAVARDAADLSGFERVISVDPRRPDGTPTPVAHQSATAPTTVDGRPATLFSLTFADGKYPYYGLLWQPVDGVWIGLSSQTEIGVAELWSDVDALDLHRAHQVRLPFRLSRLPVGAKLLDCTAGVPAAGEPYAVSMLTVGDAHGWAGIQVGSPASYSVQPPSRSGPPAPDESLPAPNRTVAGHPVLWTGETLLTNDWNGVPLNVGVGDGYGQAEATEILAGLKLSADLTDPSTWPADPTAGATR